MPDEPTLGEAHRRIDKIEARIDNRLVSLGTYNAERAHDQREVADLDRRIGKIEDRQTWVWRAAVGGIIAPIIVGLVLFVLLRGQ